jgi:hypothetical protein
VSSREIVDCNVLPGLDRGRPVRRARHIWPGP